MRQLVAVVLENDVDAVTRELLNEGVMHFISMRSLVKDTSSSLRPVGKPEYAGSAAAIRRRIESLLDAASLDTYAAQELDIAKLKPVDLDEAAKTVSAIEAKTSELRQEFSNAGDEIRHLKDIQRQVELYGDLSRGIGKQSDYSYLTMQTGAVPLETAESLHEAFSQMPVVAVALHDQGGERQFFIIGLKRDEKKIDEILNKLGWHDLDLSSSLEDTDKDVTENLKDRTAALSKKQSKIESEIGEAVSKQSEKLTELWANLRMNELYSRIQSFFSRTARTILFTGWVPAASSEKLDAGIRQACRGACYLEWYEPSEQTEAVDVPVQLENPKFLKPFEMLVKNYAVPVYGSIDPTPLVGIAYLAMFGLMFGDVGHGLVIMLLGIIGRRLYKKENKVRQLLTLLSYCGGAAIIAGVLFGSYFGFSLFPALWFDFHGIVMGHSGGPLVSSIYDVLGITIYFGISVIGLGILINLVNLARRRRWFEFFFDKAGILGGFIYGAGIWATKYFISADYKQLPSGTLLFVFLGIPVILLAFKSPLHHVLERRSGGKQRLHLMSFVDFTMDWIVEVLEIFSGYLANTLSFMRVAGLGIAHEALLIAFFGIAGMTGNGSLNSLPAILILILGNVLVIALEGLSAGIQSLRLNYYEFFSKYFSSAGRPYEPVTLRTKT
ncbi:MAG: ATPase V [Spirochaetales bacterium]|nr:ATPase V [Spirochaetales bacterium]